jgi:hypothetical protein
MASRWLRDAGFATQDFASMEAARESACARGRDVALVVSDRSADASGVPFIALAKSVAETRWASAALLTADAVDDESDAAARVWLARGCDEFLSLAMPRAVFAARARAAAERASQGRRLAAAHHELAAQCAAAREREARITALQLALRSRGAAPPATAAAAIADALRTPAQLLGARVAELAAESEAAQR